MSVVVGTDSYATIDEATAYFAARLNSSAWTAASDANKETALKQATRMLDSFVDWIGVRTEPTQALAWPRCAASDAVELLVRDGAAIASDEIPEAVKQATCEQALHLLSFDPTRPQSLAVKGFKTAGAAGMTVEADKTARPDMLASMAIAILEAGLGRLRAGATVGGGYCGNIIRG